ncbi:uncharacterized protein B0T15DRAFT_421419, partial [Chaetomium strumarium]
MDSSRSGFFNGRIARALLAFNNFVILASSVITTAILAYLIHRSLYRGTHLIYNLVISVLTLFLYLFLVVLPAVKRYRGYALPLNLLLTYLWLTSLIFSSQDYSGGRCRFFSPPGIDRCGMKHTIQAFFIIGFSFLLFNTILEALMWATHKRNE